MKMLKKISIIATLLVVLTTGRAHASNPNLPVYRALIMGNGEYMEQEADLHGALEDPYKLEDMFKNTYFYENNKMGDRNIQLKFNSSGSKILQNIKTFFKDNDDRDVSYIYYGGHGAIVEGQSSLIGVDMHAVGVTDLEEALRDLKGHFIIILDSCNSGGFTDEEILVGDVRVKNPLRNPKYSIITAARAGENSREEEIDRNWGYSGLFTKTLLDGMGYRNSYKADINKDGIVTLGELFDYSTSNLSYSHPTLYTNDKNMQVAGSKSPEMSLDRVDNWKDRYKNIGPDDIWKIRFDEEVDNQYINNNIYFLTGDNIQVKILDYRLHDDKKGVDIPNYKYLEKSKPYKLIVDENLKSKNSRHDKNLVIDFKTK